jgi:small conductance mechanosensitive channel
MKDKVRIVVASIVFITALLLFGINNSSVLAADFNNLIAVNTSGSNSYMDQLLNKSSGKDSSKKEPTIVKEHVVIHGKELFNIASTNDFEAKYRALTIRTALDDAVSKALADGNENISAKVVNEDGVYSVKVNGETIVTVTDEDSKINNRSKYSLARTWRNEIRSVIRDYKKGKSFTDKLNSPVKILYAFLFLIIFLGITELFKLKLAKFFLPVSKYMLIKINGCVVRVWRDVNTFSFDDEEKVKNLDGKIETAITELKKIFKFTIRVLQFLSIVIFINFSLYVLPFTNELVEGLTNFELSILSVIQETFSDMLFSPDTWEKMGRVAFIVFLITVVMWIIGIVINSIRHLTEAMIEGSELKGKRIQTISEISLTTMNIILIVIGFLLVLSEIGFNITPIVAGAGIIGLAISFGSQSLVKDIISGFFILIEDQFSIGDAVEIDGVSGQVEKMTMRITIIRDLSGRAHILPNGAITKVCVSSKEWSRANIDIGVSYKSDLDKAIALVKETADSVWNEFPAKIIEEPEVLGVNELRDSSVVIKLIMKTAPAEQWFVEREFKRRIKYCFDNNGIDVPYPHRVVYLQGEQK